MFMVIAALRMAKSTTNKTRHATKYSKAHSILYEVTQKYISSDIHIYLRYVTFYAFNVKCLVMY